MWDTHSTKYSLRRWRRIRARNDIALANPNEEYKVEFQAPHEGQPATIFARRIVMKGEDGKAQFLLTILENASEMRRLSREVEASKRFLDYIINSLPISVVVKSADDLRYLLVNRVFEQLTGKTRDEVVGKRMNTFCGAENSDSIEKFDRAAIAGVASAQKISYRPITRRMVRRCHSEPSVMSFGTTIRSQSF